MPDARSVLRPLFPYTLDNLLVDDLDAALAKPFEERIEFCYLPIFLP